MRDPDREFTADGATTDPRSAALVFHDLTRLPPEGPPVATLRVPRQQPGRRPTVARTPSARHFGPADPEVDAAARAVTGEVFGRDRDGRRGYPSAGGLYAVRGHLVQSHAGTVLACAGDHQPTVGVVDPGAVRANAFDQVSGAPNWVVLTARQPRYQERYGLRGYRYLLLEAGHLAQCLLDAAARAGLRALPVGAFDDEGLAGTLGLRGADQLPLYLIALGR
ncbi:nitroreductase family protein [Micromonospora sp. WMMD712]|uniref:nitroreductase family protein n=1 Tax=Micromonospora sp. WMMD712 TaxID=3016096 RepID=UPI00249A3A5C|nr:nitroreductase family protein [Micromonospora sp. WMMD712]WFE56850.1 nitroreductase family protein [Micromonospora sp. WMMD712]